MPRDITILSPHVVDALDLATAARHIRRGQAQLPVHVGRGDAEREQPVGLQRHADLTGDAAEAFDAADAPNALDRPGDHVVHEPRQVLGRHSRRRSAVDHDR